MDQGEESALVASGTSDIPKPGGIKWIAAWDFAIASLSSCICYLTFNDLAGPVFLALSLFHFATGVYLLRRKPLWRKIQIGISYFHFLLIPIGPLLVPWILWYLRRPHVKHAFGMEVSQEALSAPRNPKLVKRMAIATALSPFVLFLLLIPNLRLAHRRAGQNKTMNAIRSIGTALESYAVDHNAYPRGSTTVAEIEKYIYPTYIKTVPHTDYWENEYLYRSDSLSYTIISVGKDKMVDAAFHPGPTTHFESDLVFSNGNFVAYSEGT